MLFRRRHGMSPSAREALARVVSAPTFELIPLKDAMDHAASLPPGARVSVTASPIKGIESTIALCEQLQAAGFRAVPHISSRMVRDRAQLSELLASLEAAGVDRAFVVGGDAKTHGQFPDGLSLLREMNEIGHPLREIGIPCYPQGHPFIADGPLLDALREKATYANYMTTQLCFEPAAIASWLAARRSEGISLPVHIGVPGVTEPHRLLAISARIGVADAHRFLSKNIRFVARLVRSGGFFRPDALLEGLAPHIADPTVGIVDLHLYTFNAVSATETWRRRYLEALAPASLTRPTAEVRPAAGRAVR
jgi:methylenetetrahydrofolate reductase (NADPH)